MKKSIALLLLGLIFFGILAGCGSNEGNDFRDLEDFAHARMGIITGSAHDVTARRVFPDAERSYFYSIADMVFAVEQGKIDCYMEDEPFMAALVWENAGVTRIEEPVAQVDTGFAFPKGEGSRALREQVNEFLLKAQADGTIERLKEKWLGDTEPEDHPDYTKLTGENGTIRMGLSVDNKPLSYKYRDQCSGLEIELLTLFAQEYGYAFEIEEVPFESVITGLAAGKYDIAASALNITPEREESVDFSIPYSTFDVVLIVKADSAQEQSEKTLADFGDASLGVMTGSVYDDYAKERFPGAERKYYSIMTDMILAVEQGKIDGYIAENVYVTAAQWEGANVAMLDEVIDQTHAGYIFRKSDAITEIREQLNAFLIDAKESGLIEELHRKWFADAEPEGHPDFSTLTGENGTIKIAAATDLKPISYLKGNEISGYEMEMLWLFANEYGYKLDISTVTFDTILPGVTTGKYDIGTGAITITEERAQSVDFSESHLTVNVVMVVKAEEDAGQEGFWAGIRDSFEKTFIREDRWKLIVEGVGVTMFISICSAAAGTLLGFGLYMLSRSHVKGLQLVANGIAKVYSRIIAGTPVVVILMILFYVVFGRFRNISGVLVAIIGFTLTFGAFVYDHLTVSVNSVDRGQTEAAYALGYTKNKTFFRIVFPQAMSVFLPSYCGQAVELIKATAVVGYVAVNDLTKVGDIIRSNTYEAFFPLISTAAIYFLLTWILSLLLGIVKVKFEPKRRSEEKILKGVKTV